jgi:ATP-dependent DNA ligase
MLARLSDEIPDGEGWRYEPKWDGFRAVVFRDAEKLELVSRNGQPLARYFPELVTALFDALPLRCVVDGEIVIAAERGLDFDALLQRVHPAASRIARLAKETPSSFVVFDLLALGEDDLRPRPFAERRRALESLLRSNPQVHLTPQTDQRHLARRWFLRFEGAGLDGVVAKRTDTPYIEGERVMVKVKHRRTADCVVGGYRHAKQGGVGSLLLGLYDDEGQLQYVGHTSSFDAKARTALLKQLAPLEGGTSFGEGRAPGGLSRWNRGQSTGWVPLTPSLICEVAFDHLQGQRFRHATRFLRWRPDKRASECTFDQLVVARPFSLAAIFESAPLH